MTTTMLLISIRRKAPCCKLHSSFWDWFDQIVTEIPEFLCKLFVFGMWTWFALIAIHKVLPSYTFHAWVESNITCRGCSLWFFFLIRQWLVTTYLDFWTLSNVTFCTYINSGILKWWSERKYLGDVLPYVKGEDL